MNLAETLNLGCLCSTLRADALDVPLDGRPHLFSASPFFIRERDRAAIVQAVAALERVAALPPFVQAAISRAPAAASRTTAASGVFMGYDFHLAPEGPRLIEINTNAGGAFLHAAALQAHRACCRPVMPWSVQPPPPDALDNAFMDMFRAEWRSERAEAPWRTVAIVDESPATQYLAPEFERARALFERHGLTAFVADPSGLTWRDGRLWLGDVAIDLVYNRLTDFYLESTAAQALRHAWEAGAVVLTPHPRAHAVHADKRNLVTLGDPASLAAWGARADDLAVIASVVPEARPVTPENADALWADRKRWFFKPSAGYGSRAAYRGDKLTRRVWDEIRAGGFVAQAFVAPSERAVRVGGAEQHLKVDIRAYAYRGDVLLLAARTYQGQTTNFRTPGGGFAPIVTLPDFAPACRCTS